MIGCPDDRPEYCEVAVEEDFQVEGRERKLRQAEVSRQHESGWVRRTRR